MSRLAAGNRQSRGRLGRRESPFPTSDGRRASTGVEARAGAMAWARSFAADPLTVYLDTETTGLGAHAEVVDIAVIAADASVLFESLVRPTTPIPSDASAIHGIYDAHVEGAPDWPNVNDRLRDLLEGRRVVVYNAAFDRRLITQSCVRHGLVVPNSSWHCAMQAYARFHGEPNPARGGFR